MFKYVIEAVLNPFVLILLLYAGSLVLLFRQKPRHKLFSVFFLILIFFVVLSSPWIARTLTHTLERQYPVITKPGIQSGWIVVLGGGQSEADRVPANSVLTTVSISRLVEGVRLYRQLSGAKLLLSGGGTDQKRSEAYHMATLAKWMLVPDSDIIQDTISLNTAEQAKKIRQILGNQSFYLVTSAIHMPRAMMLCRAEGLHPIAAPTNFNVYWEDRIWVKKFFPNPHNIVYLGSALHEFLGIGWSKLTVSPARSGTYDFASAT